MHYGKFIKMILGQILYSFAISLTVQADVGYCPWDVFHAGIAGTLYISIGTAITIISIALLLISFPMRWRIGLGTITNVLLCGSLVDVFNGVIPVPSGLFHGILMFCAGVIVLAFASYLYIEPGYGTSVRDSLFVFLTKKMGGHVAKGRISMELGLMLIGFLLGGKVGIGSVICCAFCGPCMQTVNRMMRFELASAQHENLQDTVRRVISCCQNRKVK